MKKLFNNILNKRNNSNNHVNCHNIKKNMLSLLLLLIALTLTTFLPNANAKKVYTTCQECVKQNRLGWCPIRRKWYVINSKIPNKINSPCIPLSFTLTTTTTNIPIHSTHTHANPINTTTTHNQQWRFCKSKLSKRSYRYDGTRSKRST